MRHFQVPGWKASFYHPQPDSRHLRFYLNCRESYEDSSRLVWRLSLTDHQHNTYEYVWVLEDEVRSIVDTQDRNLQWEKCDYYLRRCGKTLHRGDVKGRQDGRTGS